jgi:ABC-type uncharacterized transport system permease subunit
VTDNGATKAGDQHQVVDWINLYYRLAPVTVPFFAIICALVVAGVIIWLTGPDPTNVVASLDHIKDAYWALWNGMYGDADKVADSVARSIPFIGAALAVAFAFKAGLFNIGVEGQILMGALAAAWVGTWSWLQGVPGVFAIPMVLIAGLVGGLLWGGIPGVLKARTGAHEVIVTIMLNAIAVRIVAWLVSSQDPKILRARETVPGSAEISEKARLPKFTEGNDLSLALLVAVIMCAIVWFVLKRTSFGFEVKNVGLNPSASRYSGINVNRTIVLVMALSGAIAGVTGAAEISGLRHELTVGVLAAVGFDAIAIALLARANPWAIIPAAFLWGSLLSGQSAIQLQDVSSNVVRIIQGLILLFVAADAIVRYLFHIKRVEGETGLEAKQYGSGWGAAT